VQENVLPKYPAGLKRERRKMNNESRGKNDVRAPCSLEFRAFAKQVAKATGLTVAGLIRSLIIERGSELGMTWKPGKSEE